MVQVIEQQLNNLDGFRYMSSESNNDGSATIIVTFDQGTDPDIAQVQVQNKLQLATLLLVGKPLESKYFTAIELDGLRIEENLPLGLPSDLLVSRPDILAAEYALRAANSNVGAARAAFFPSITLTASAGSASSDLGQMFAGGQGAWTFVPSINVPIFNAGPNQANLDVARIQTSIEVANYQKAIQVAFREVADSLVARDSFTMQVLAETRLVQANQRNS